MSKYFPRNLADVFEDLSNRASEAKNDAERGRDVSEIVFVLLGLVHEAIQMSGAKPKLTILNRDGTETEVEPLKPWTPPEDFQS